MKIAFISSASLNFDQTLLSIIKKLISELSHISKLEILTGGSKGVPGEFIKQAKLFRIKTIAYSPDISINTHNNREDNLELEYFSEVRHIEGFTARSLVMIQDSDAVIMMNGRIGSLSEATIALEEGKYLAILTGTGGVADHMECILNTANKEFPGMVFFSDSSEEIVSWLRKNVADK